MRFSYLSSLAVIALVLSGCGSNKEPASAPITKESGKLGETEKCQIDAVTLTYETHHLEGKNLNNVYETCRALSIVDTQVKNVDGYLNNFKVRDAAEDKRSDYIVYGSRADFINVRNSCIQRTRLDYQLVDPHFIYVTPLTSFTIPWPVGENRQAARDVKVLWGCYVPCHLVKTKNYQINK